MSPHALVTQLHFARREFVRCLDGVSAEDAVRRLKPMNCISWIIGHLALSENYLWVLAAQREIIYPELKELVGYNRPASTPPLDEMWEAWYEITATADIYLDTLTHSDMDNHLQGYDEPLSESIGITLLRNIYHYWFHTGEAHAIRQQLGHSDLPQFVGKMDIVKYG